MENIPQLLGKETYWYGVNRFLSLAIIATLLSFFIIILSAFDKIPIESLQNADVKIKLTAVASHIATLLALIKILLNEANKQMENAIKFTERVITDPRLILACRTLDYIARDLPLPATYSSLKPPILRHTIVKMANAMIPGPVMTRPEQGIYCDIFDDLFTFLCEVNRCIDTGLFPVQYVHDRIYYILARICDPCAIIEKTHKTDNGKMKCSFDLYINELVDDLSDSWQYFDDIKLLDTKDIENLFKAYIVAYKYEDVVKLMDKFDRIEGDENMRFNYKLNNDELNIEDDQITTWIKYDEVAI